MPTKEAAPQRTGLEGQTYALSSVDISDDLLAMTMKTHLMPTDCVMNPPAMGPATGPDFANVSARHGEKGAR